MALTPNFGFEVPVGTDTVNLLTQCYPNFTSLDTILKAIQDAGVTTATATKTGTVFNVVRTVTSCNVFRFVATANYVSGDTFTVDGVSVTATAVDGTALDTGAFVINQSVVGVLNGTVLTILVKGSNASSSASDVTYDNTVSGLTATDVQNAIDELVTMIESISLTASNVSYDNTGSGLSATNVQDAIDEVKSLIAPQGSLYELTEHTVGSATACDIKKDGVTLTTLNNTGVTTFSDALINVSFVSGWVLKANVNVTADGVPVSANGTIFTIGSYSGVTKTARVVAQ